MPGSPSFGGTIGSRSSISSDPLPPPATVPVPRMSSGEVLSLLAGMGLRPSRAMGQNFLTDLHALQALVDLIHPLPGQRILEVGPGLGALTLPLLLGGARVVAVEKDPRLHRHLARELAGWVTLDLREGDVMDLGPAALLAEGPDRVAANLPYSISSRFLVDCVEAPHPPRDLVLTVQKEVAERLAAAPGGKDYGLVSVLVRANYRVAIHRRLSRGCFTPAPQVESAMVRIERRETPRLPPGPVRARFKQLVKAGFGQRRKQLQTALRPLAGREAADRLMAVGIQPAQRAETVAVEQWIALAEAWG